ncbi:50S ribosomal protein L24 [Aureliella helgolandensis]|uniref:Large ribosomal subunit protein uL24 n=1 Tax=Aureliella helgolandensis TaxID=2527968 RepID=A0A518G231_9BACT|nr:50S ribosomal protein L24 [Aureliella helgolandensis]QDV22634.1 50S ribosomal protein L24 [Aureliella helgolandensis]|tara:strand:+ start:231 stop:578 length:348 start_codon:yes stop_codon:yes gene_type:complete
MLFREQDEVLVISGADKGTSGKVLKVDRENSRVIVEGVNKVYKHVKRSGKNPQGGRLSKEMPIDASNVMLLCPQTGKRTRVGVRYLKDGSKERFAKKSGASLGVISPAKARYAQQ